jgi:hypothetical protein
MKAYAPVERIAFADRLSAKVRALDHLDSGSGAALTNYLVSNGGTPLTTRPPSQRRNPAAARRAVLG